MKVVDYAACSDAGRVRPNNEDSFGSFPDFGVWCVADGMGGGDDGEIASSSIIRMLGNALMSVRAESDRDLTLEERVSIIREVANEASRWLKDRAQAVGSHVCGTTLVGVIVDAANRIAVFHVGDSRAYSLSGGKLERLTQDHSFAEALHMRESKLPPQMRCAVLRAVGIEESVDLDVSEHQCLAGDRIVLCSDGLTRMVPDAEIARVLAVADETCSKQADALVSAANKAGGVDNVTVMVLRIGSVPPQEKTGMGIDAK